MIDSSTSKKKGKNFCKSLVVSHLFTYFAAENLMKVACWIC